MATSSPGRLRRLRRGIVGLAIVMVGIVLMPLPGPGTIIVLVGLGYLRRDFAWAGRLLDAIRRRLRPGSDRPS